MKLSIAASIFFVLLHPSLTNAGVLAVFKPKPLTPEVVAPKVPSNPSRPKPQSPNKPEPRPEPEKEANGMNALEQSLEGLEDVMDIVGAAKDIAEAILGLGDTSTFISDVFQPTETQAPTQITFTPTSSVPVTSFTACTSYASILTSCASATPSFYSASATEQALCACYTAPTKATSSACSTSTPIVTLATEFFDDLANECWDYFHRSGYEEISDLMLDTTSVPGALFCESVDEYLKDASSNSTGAGTGLQETQSLDGQGQCPQPVQEDDDKGNAGGRVGRSLLVSASAVVLWFLVT